MTILKELPDGYVPIKVEIYNEENLLIWFSECTGNHSYKIREVPIKEYINYDGFDKFIDVLRCQKTGNLQAVKKLRKKHAEYFI